MKPEIQDEKPIARSVIEIVESYDNTSILCSRWIGCWMDLITLFLIFFIPNFLLGDIIYQRLIYLWLLLAFAYFPITEWYWGRTLGKVVSGTVVVNKYGNNPNIVQAVLRSILRLVEVNPFLFGGIPAGIIVLISKRKQRAGDILAGTYVVFLKDLKRLQATKNPLG